MPKQKTNPSQFTVSSQPSRNNVRKTRERSEYRRFYKRLFKKNILEQARVSEIYSPEFDEKIRWPCSYKSIKIVNTPWVCVESPTTYPESLVEKGEWPLSDDIQNKARKSAKANFTAEIEAIINREIGETEDKDPEMAASLILQMMYTLLLNLEVATSKSGSLATVKETAISWDEMLMIAMTSKMPRVIVESVYQQLIARYRQTSPIIDQLLQSSSSIPLMDSYYDVKRKADIAQWYEQQQKDPQEKGSFTGEDMRYVDATEKQFIDSKVSIHSHRL
ncbi:hypothetical protein BDF14DRAFT_178791 [Spinellus fusiger]|nr:hypothetical protein BDF14DRAFT_178791 [Spinellus fusiger]